LNTQNLFKMKKLLILSLILISSLSACKQNEKKGLSTDIIQNGKTPKMTFDKTSYDFGVITEGDIMSYTFDFTNTGDGDLLITDAHGQCSCTVPEWPKEPIKPGDKGEIKVKFDSNGKHGLVTKMVTIEANTNPKDSKIEIKADVHPAPVKK